MEKQEEKILSTDEELAEVIEVMQGEVIVSMQRKGGCKSCSMSALCMGGASKKEFSVKTDMELVKGDIVKLNISPSSRMLSSLIVFILPIVFLILGYFIIKLVLKMQEDFAVFGSLLTMLLSIFVLKYADKKLSNKISVEIIEKITSDKCEEMVSK